MNSLMYSRESIHNNNNNSNNNNIVERLERFNADIMGISEKYPGILVLIPIHIELGSLQKCPV